MRVDMIIKVAYVLVGVVLLILSTTADLTGLSINNSASDPVFGPIQIAATMVSIIVIISGVILFIFWRPKEEQDIEDEAEAMRKHDEEVVAAAYAAADKPREKKDLPVRGPPKSAEQKFSDKDLDQFAVDTETYGQSGTTDPTLEGDVDGVIGIEDEEAIDESDLEGLEDLDVDDLDSIEDVEEYECPTCGYSVKFDDLACPYCGESFADEYECPNCGEAIEEGDTECPKCGEKFDPEDFE